MMIKIINDYHVTHYTDVELPEAKTPDDIEDVGFKWGRGSILFKDGTSMEGIEEDKESEGDCFKRPLGIKVTDEEFENEIVFEEG